jgi:hypothetical protein
MTRKIKWILAGCDSDALKEKEPLTWGQFAEAIEKIKNTAVDYHCWLQNPGEIILISDGAEEIEKLPGVEND